MALALRLAAKGQGRTSPNPMVGAVVVASNRIVGQGYHRRAGGPHAEVIALQAAGPRTQGATLYVTLEPCCHTEKRTPPCVPVLIAAGLKRVVVAMPDPNPHVGGRGIRALRKASLEVAVGCQRDEAERLNEAYRHWVRTGLPFVTLKAAMTMDGKIATAGGESQWITGEPARRYTHQLRSRMDAILVGAGTVQRDDPRLTVRLGRGAVAPKPTHQPLRVILDSRLRIPLISRVLGPGTVIATTAQAPAGKIRQAQAKGAQILVLPARNGRVSLRACLAELGKQGITSVLIEGGSEINASAIRAGLVNRVALFIAPTLLGGQDAKGLIGGLAPKRLAQAMPLDDIRIQPLGRDFLLEGTLSTK
ncbi:MAG: bifunctional diaminohydroxyphosphoribosylaminopyrimidine deaminase/5-amino-6-(5-phosphoribosylamino)uracil reductase RibD [Nitrospirae bacterium]|nr:MAG: bifunctional diaminohydroxyphosphoribosylaminopyrimidine deaminase/5-amino-6-(5-phosphoribosylamino)uracil reductase RibD [Nitrospirota bacterium]